MDEVQFNWGGEIFVNGKDWERLLLKTFFNLFLKISTEEAVITEAGG